MIVYTGGTFDLYHRGHANLLKNCRRIAGDDGIVVVSLNSDEFVKKYKGKAPILSFGERKAVIESTRYADMVIKNIGGADSKATIEALIKSGTNPDVVVIGSDWHGRDYLEQMNFDWDWLTKRDIFLCYVPYTKGISTTKIKKMM